MRILFLSRWYPYPPDNGSKLRIYNLLRGLAQEHEVTLLSFADRADVDPDVPALRSLCRQVQIVRWKEFEPQSWRARLGFFGLTPRSVLDTFSPEMAGRIQQALSTRDYDLVIASQWPMAAYGRCWGELAAVFEEVEIGVPYERFARATSAWQRLRHGLTWAKHRAYLTRLMRHFRACTVVSDQEQRLLSRAIPGFEPIEVIPNCINLSEYVDVHEAPRANSLIFTGSFRYLANHDAMTWFLQDAYPYLQAQVPDVRLTITGDHAGLPLPAAENVTRTGFVEDVRPLIASAWVSVVPIRVGGGTRLKILEAMALGTPVVATSKGAEGLGVQDGENILIADTPEAFARAVLLLLADPGLRTRLAGKGYELIRDKYDWATVMPGFLDLIERVAYA
jgi:glycosyltransferase involved in cell wall biosynthesis